MVGRFLSCILFCLLIFGGGNACAQGQQSACEQPYSDWSKAFEKLLSVMDQLSTVKSESIEHKIRIALESGAKATIAQVIQQVTRERNRAIADLSSQCYELSDRERYAFDQFKKCRAAETRNKEDQYMAGLNKNRYQTWTQLQELLLDEAYVQYKKESPNPPSMYSQQNSRNPAQMNSPLTDRRIGFGPTNSTYGMH